MEVQKSKAIFYRRNIIGLHTWSLSRNGQEDNSIILAEDAVHAVEKAISLAKGHKLN